MEASTSVSSRKPSVSVSVSLGRRRGKLSLRRGFTKELGRRSVMIPLRVCRAVS